MNREKNEGAETKKRNKRKEAERERERTREREREKKKFLSLSLPFSLFLSLCAFRLSRPSRTFFCSLLIFFFVEKSISDIINVREIRASEHRGRFFSRAREERTKKEKRSKRVLFSFFRKNSGCRSFFTCREKRRKKKEREREFNSLFLVFSFSLFHARACASVSSRALVHSARDTPFHSLEREKGAEEREREHEARGEKKETKETEQDAGRRDGDVGDHRRREQARHPRVGGSGWSVRPVDVRGP